MEAEKESSNKEYMQDCLLRLSWALVHSKHPQDVQRGIAMLEGISFYSFIMQCNYYLSMYVCILIHSQITYMYVCMYMALAGSLPSTKDPLQQREKLYLLAVGYYRTADYSRSRDLVDRCLMVSIYLLFP